VFGTLPSAVRFPAGSVFENLFHGKNGAPALPEVEAGLAVSLMGNLLKPRPEGKRDDDETRRCNKRLGCRLLGLSTGSGQITGSFSAGPKEGAEFGVGATLDLQLGDVLFGNGFVVEAAKVGMQLDVGDKTGAAESLSANLAGKFRYPVRTDKTGQPVELLTGSLSASLHGGFDGGRIQASVTSGTPWRGLLNALGGKINLANVTGNIDLMLPELSKLAKGGAVAGQLHGSANLCIGPPDACFRSDASANNSRVVEGRAFVSMGADANTEVLPAESSDNGPAQRIKNTFMVGLIRNLTVNNMLKVMAGVDVQVPVVGELGFSGHETGCPALPAVGPVTALQIEKAAPCAMLVTAAVRPQSGAEAGSTGGVNAGVAVAGGIAGAYEILGFPSRKLRMNAELLMVPDEDTIRTMGQDMKNNRSGLVLPGKVAAAYVDISPDAALRFFSGLITIGRSAQPSSKGMGPRMLVDVKTGAFAEALASVDTGDAAWNSRAYLTGREEARDLQRNSLQFKSLNARSTTTGFAAWIGGQANLLGTSAPAEVELRNKTMHLRSDLRLWDLFKAHVEVDALLTDAQDPSVCIRGVLQQDLISLLDAGVRTKLLKAKEQAGTSIQRWNDQIAASKREFSRRRRRCEPPLTPTKRR
jgi:hypothetical protein